MIGLVRRVWLALVLTLKNKPHYKGIIQQRPPSSPILRGPMSVLGLVLAAQAAFIAPAQAQAPVPTNNLWVAPSQRNNATTTILGPTPRNWAGVRLNPPERRMQFAYLNFTLPEDMILPPTVAPTAKLVFVVNSQSFAGCRIELGASFAENGQSSALVVSGIPDTNMTQVAGVGKVVELSVSSLFDPATIPAVYSSTNDQYASVRVKVKRKGDGVACDLMLAGMRFDYEGMADGATGPQGPAGPAGPQGPAGANGADGTPGADGAPGPQGIQGLAGADGANGAPGPTGTAGLMCWDLNANGQADLPAEDRNGDGTVDTDDCAGPQGATGADGADGTDGATGATGPQDHKAPLEPMARMAPQVPMVPQVRRVSKASLEPMARMVPKVQRVPRV